jgi:hypothetical protein
LHGIPVVRRVISAELSVSSRLHSRPTCQATPEITPIMLGGVVNMNYMCNYCLENTASLPLLDPSPSMLLVYKSLHYQTGHLNFVVAPCVLTVACRKSVLEQWIAV